MKNKTLIMAGIATAFVGLISTASALPITGTIDMQGSMELDGGSLDSATGASFSPNPAATVTDTSGSYAHVPDGTGVTWFNFSWNPASATPFELWTFKVGNWTYTFNVTSMSVVTQDDTSLYLSGGGRASITGLGSPNTISDATWNLDITRNPNNELTYSFDFNDP